MPDLTRALAEQVQLAQKLIIVRTQLMASKDQINAALDTLQQTVDGVQSNIGALITQVQAGQTDEGLDSTTTDAILERLQSIQADLGGTSFDTSLQTVRDAQGDSTSSDPNDQGSTSQQLGATGTSLPPGTSTSGGMAGGETGAGGTVGGTDGFSR